MTEQPNDNVNALGRLRQAIIDNTRGDLFWIGEILLAELEKETGFPCWIERAGTYADQTKESDMDKRIDEIEPVDDGHLMVHLNATT